MLCHVRRWCADSENKRSAVLPEALCDAGACIIIWNLLYGEALKTPPGVEDSFLNLTFSCQRCEGNLFNNLATTIRFMLK